MKSYLVDTSVIIHNPHFLNDFKNAKITITLDVLNELDKLKTKPNETGKNARVFIRLLDEIIGNHSLADGINCGNDCLLFIDGNIYSSDKFGDKTYCDNKLLQAAEGKDITLLSRDISLRLKARAIGIKTENYSKIVQNDDLYLGYRTIVSEEIGTILKENKIVGCEDFEEFKGLYPNECVNIVGDDGKTISLGRKIGNIVQYIKSAKPWGLSPKGIEQIFAIELIMSSDVPLVSLTGGAGGGKTLIAMACALELLLNQKKYENLIIYRPAIELGASLGFLPGGYVEKKNPFFSALEDTLNILFSTGKKKKNSTKPKWQDILAQYENQISMETISFCRGRSIQNTLIICDEMQNLTNHEVKSLCSRLGQGSKIICTGDPSQIDHKDLDIINNGFSHMIESFKPSDLTGHVALTKCHRSALAELVSTL